MFKAENAVYVPGYFANCLSTELLRDKGVWVHGYEGNLYYGKPGKETLVCKLQRVHGLAVMEYKPL